MSVQFQNSLNSNSNYMKYCKKFTEHLTAKLQTLVIADYEKEINFMLSIRQYHIQGNNELQPEFVLKCSVFQILRNIGFTPNNMDMDVQCFPFGWKDPLPNRFHMAMPLYGEIGLTLIYDEPEQKSNDDGVFTINIAHFNTYKVITTHVMKDRIPLFKSSNCYEISDRDFTMFGILLDHLSREIQPKLREYSGLILKRSRSSSGSRTPICTIEVVNMDPTPKHVFHSVRMALKQAEGVEEIPTSYGSTPNEQFPTQESFALSVDPVHSVPPQGFVIETTDDNNQGFVDQDSSGSRVQASTAPEGVVIEPSSSRNMSNEPLPPFGSVMQKRFN